MHAGVKKRSSSCPSCGEDEVLRIQYGYPSPELIEDARRGEVELGGCCISDENPVWRCRTCGHEWGRMLRK
jgi:predicted RNA-binding Zn-ribbon protein involved in translation (DUF1610 family)